MGADRTARGFTLIELLVVIAIIAILAAILFPVFMQAKKNAMGTKCMSNLRSIGMAFKQYNEDWNGRYMPALGWTGPNWPSMTWPFPYLLQRYCRNQAIFLCPTAPKGPHDFDTSDWYNADAKDCGWYCPYGGVDWKSHYGHNINLGGWDQERGFWGPTVPTESQVRNRAEFCTSAMRDGWT